LVKKEKIRVVLFALTGFGNAVLEALLKDTRVRVAGLFTRPKSKKPFPHYPCVQLMDLARKNKVSAYTGNINSALTVIKKIRPDLILVCTFDQIIPRKIIKLSRWGVINLHPSLLPRYRGATPTNWVLLRGEKETGVTAHFIENEKVDAGPIILQRKIRIHPDDNDGILRRKLAVLSVGLTWELISLLISGKIRVRQQNEGLSSWFPRRSLKSVKLDLGLTCDEILNMIRGLTPFPGVYIVKNRRRSVIKAKKISPNRLCLILKEGRSLTINCAR